MLSAIIPDSLLEGTRGHEVAEVLYVIIHSGFDWKGCNVTRAHDTIKCVIYRTPLLFVLKLVASQSESMLMIPSLLLREK